MLKGVSRAEHESQLKALLVRFLSTMSEPAQLQRLIEGNPEILGNEFDILMVQVAAELRHNGDNDGAQIVDRYRELVAECRRLGVKAAFIKANAYALMGGFLQASDPDDKIAYLRAHPELDDTVTRAALYQAIDKAEEADDQASLMLLRRNLLL